jgi:(S)-ureidoglycine aminohydrolase
MPDLFGHSRARIAARHALITPANHVNSSVPGITGATTVVLINEAMGAKFAQLLVTFTADGRAGQPASGTQTFGYVMQGGGTLTVGKDKAKITAFLGDPAANLQVLLPDEPAFDMAVNIFAYEPGGHLPFVEVHVMEHGLVMLGGAGVYRLEDSWYPVQAGDTIWMAPYCAQWFVAMGKVPASYLYYKDVNRPAI